MKLYEITNEYRNILEQTFDHETGEINELALHKLDEVKKDIKEKGIAIASYIKNLDAERKAIEEAKKSMVDREARLENRLEFLKSYLKINMENCSITEISCPYFIIKLKKCPVSVEILDEINIPYDYKKIKETVSIDKIKIKEEILSGKEIPGARLKENTRLEIR